MGRQPGADGGDRVGRSQKERPTPQEGETHRTWGVSGVKKRGGIYSNGGLCEIKAQPGKKDMETRDKNKGFSEGGELDQGMGWGGEFGLPLEYSLQAHLPPRGNCSLFQGILSPH